MSQTPHRAALVTGASRGIGFAIAKVLADEGYNVTIAGRRAEGLAKAATLLRSAGTDILPVHGNVASEEDVTALVRAHEARFGRLDVLVNNAGLGIRGPFGESVTAHIDLQLAVNLRGTILMCREALGMLRAAGTEHGRANIINISSIAGKVGAPELAVYAATKHGIVGLSDSLNRELYSAGIRVTAVCPALVDTELSRYADGWLPASQKIQTGDVAEVVRLVLRLSPNASVPDVVLMEAAALGLAGIEVNGANRVVVS